MGDSAGFLPGICPREASAVRTDDRCRQHDRICCRPSRPAFARAGAGRRCTQPSQRPSAGVEWRVGRGPDHVQSGHHGPCDSGSAGRRGEPAMHLDGLGPGSVRELCARLPYPDRGRQHDRSFYWQCLVGERCRKRLKAGRERAVRSVCRSPAPTTKPESAAAGRHGTRPVRPRRHTLPYPRRAWRRSRNARCSDCVQNPFRHGNLCYSPQDQPRKVCCLCLRALNIGGYGHRSVPPRLART